MEVKARANSVRGQGNVLGKKGISDYTRDSSSLSSGGSLDEYTVLLLEEES